MDNITEQLEGIVGQKGYISLSQLKDKLGAPAKKQLGLSSNLTSKQLQESLTSYLGEKLAFRKGGNIFYLVSKIPDEELLFRIVESRSGKTPGTIGRYIPFGKKEFIDGLNSLLEKGRVRVKKLSDSYLPTLEIVASAASATSDKVSPVSTDNYTAEAFHAAYRELARGRFSIRICDLRRCLAWPREVFDRMLKELRDKRVLQLQFGEPENFTPQDIEDAFRDENGYVMLNCTWRQ